MWKLCLWLTVAIAATAGVVAACHNEVPGQGLPLPNREMPPQGDKPRPLPLTPRPKVLLDGGILPTSTVTQTQVRIAPAAPADAAVDALDLPPNPDGSIVRDAATPLAR